MRRKKSSHQITHEEYVALIISAVSLIVAIFSLVMAIINAINVL